MLARHVVLPGDADNMSVHPSGNLMSSFVDSSHDPDFRSRSQSPRRSAADDDGVSRKRYSSSNSSDSEGEEGDGGGKDSARRRRKQRKEEKKARKREKKKAKKKSSSRSDQHRKKGGQEERGGGYDSNRSSSDQGGDESAGPARDAATADAAAVAGGRTPATARSQIESASPAATVDEDAPTPPGSPAAAVATKPSAEGPLAVNGSGGVDDDEACVDEDAPTPPASPHKTAAEVPAAGKNSFFAQLHASERKKGTVGTIHATGNHSGGGGGAGGGGGGIQSSDWECLKCGKSNYKNASACDRYRTLPDRFRMSYLVPGARFLLPL